MTKPAKHVIAGTAGTRSGYSRGCRCDECATDGRTENALYQREYRAGLRGGSNPRQAVRLLGR